MVSSSVKAAVTVGAITALGIYCVNPSFMSSARSSYGANSLKIGVWAGVSVILANWIHDLVPM